MRKRVLLGGLVLLLAATVPVLAGPNGGGSIIVHTNDAYAWKTSTVCTTTLGEPADCASAITRTDKAASVVVWFLAAFVPTATPDVRTVYFGVNFDDVNLGIDNYKYCGSGLEAPDEFWPSNTQGTTWGFNASMTTHVFRFYWFVVSELGDPVVGEYFCSAANATGGYASFIDSALTEDVITRFGCVHWYEAGTNTCPTIPPTGACCLSNLACTIVSSIAECTNAGGIYQGDNTICDRPCSACCYWRSDPPIRDCVVTTEIDCTTGTWNAQIVDDGFGHQVGATWSGATEAGVGNECAANATEAATKWWCQDPREINATKPTTWGQLKAIYR